MKKITETRCSCGVGQDAEYVACVDRPEKRKTKCPCFKNGNECEEGCACHNCGNGKVRETEMDVDEKEVIPRRKQGHRTHKKERTTKHLERSDDRLPDGPWTDQETMALLCCFELLMAMMDIPKDMEHLHKLYTMLSDSSLCKGKPLFLRKKTLKSVQCKFAILQKQKK